MIAADGASVSLELRVLILRGRERVSRKALIRRNGSLGRKAFGPSGSYEPGTLRPDGILDRKTFGSRSSIERNA